MTCPNCHNDVVFHQVRSDRKASLYFVPIATTGTDQYLLCPICSHGLELRPAHRPTADTMRATTALYRSGRMAEDAYRMQVDRFWTAIGVTPRSAPPAEVAGATGPAMASIDGVADRLADLGRLHDQGVLSDEEFAAAKRRLLGL